MKHNLSILKFVAVSIAMLSQSGLANSPEKAADTLVFQRNGRLEAIRKGQSKPIVLRQRFSIGDRVGNDWAMSNNGQTLMLSRGYSGHVFNALAARQYLYLARFNSKRQVFLGAYEKKAPSQHSLIAPALNFSGTKVLFTAQSEYGVGPTEMRLMTLWPKKTIWASRRAENTIPQLTFVSASGQKWKRYGILSGTLSPSEKEVICLAQPEPRNGSQYPIYLEKGQPLPPLYILHFDLTRNTGRVVYTFRDSQWISQYFQDGEEKRVSGKDIGEVSPQFSWHPTQRKVAFVRRANNKSAKRAIFVLDLNTLKAQRVTWGDQEDFSPLWSHKGDVLYFVRGVQPGNFRANEMLSKNRIWRITSDGKNSRAIFPSVLGVTRIQAPQFLPQWEKLAHLNL